MSRTKGIALPGKSMEEATRNAQRDILPKSPNSPKAVKRGGRVAYCFRTVTQGQECHAHR